MSHNQGIVYQASLEGFVAVQQESTLHADRPIQLAYHLGCPVWSWPQWKGTVYPAGTPRAEWLTQYSRKFNSVEGNTTFYGIPTTETVSRWAEQTPDGFRFALKFPQAISHEKQLKHCQNETQLFLACLAILKKADRLGPTFLQLPPNFGPDRFPELVNYLHQLPRDFPYAVEVRHHDFFKEPFESRLNEAFRQYRVDRVIFDSRPLFSKGPQDEWESKAQKRKPQVPIRELVIGDFPILRLIGRNEIGDVDPWIESWSKLVAAWIGEGKTPFVFTHAPDDTHAPELAHRFHRGVRKRLKDAGELPALARPAKQKSLF